jgi:DNA-binding XRE family transcriptional regulator
MADIPAGAERLLKPFELGLWVARGRRRGKISQAVFAQKLGVSRKTISDLERGVAEHVSLKTAMTALSLAGFVIYCAERRPPTMEEIMARRAADRARAGELLNAGVTPSLPTPRSSTKDRRRKGSV